MARRLPPSRVSINFQDAKLVNAVRMLVSQENLNLIMGDNIKGRVTVSAGLLDTLATQKPKQREKFGPIVLCQHTITIFGRL